MTKSVILYYSGYGHTAKQAQAIHKGCSSVSGHTSSLVSIAPEGTVSDKDWESLKAADAIIFGSPTYMGGPAWQFKKIADASSKPWMTQDWKDKVAAGFTNSASMNGDKDSTIHYLFTFAMQHGMIWVGNGLLPSSTKAATRSDINWLGGFSGALAQSASDSTPDEGPHSGDLETASLLGVRVAELTNRLK